MRLRSSRPAHNSYPRCPRGPRIHPEQGRRPQRLSRHARRSVVARRRRIGVIVLYSGRRAAIHRETDRAGDNVRRSGGDSHRERAAVRRGAGTHHRARALGRGAARAQRGFPGGELNARSADRARHDRRQGGPTFRDRGGRDLCARRAAGIPAARDLRHERGTNRGDPRHARRNFRRCRPVDRRA